MQHLIESGNAEEIATLLGHRDRVRCGGVIRTGLKVPKAGLSPADLAKFKDLENKGMSYDEIDRALGGSPKTATSKLFPKNVDHFIIRDGDFTRASDAQFIREKYADTDGLVRSIPVWLTVGEMAKVIPHGFKVFGGYGLLATSFYEGDKLRVRYLPKGFSGPAKKTDWLTADFDQDNPVDPAGRKLKFGGLFLFHVKGLRGFDEIMLPTTSYYGISYSIGLLRRIRSRLGRFDGLVKGDTFLQITKSQEEVTDPKGNKVMQWIPVLELSIDPMELDAYAEGRVERGLAAASILNGRPARLAPVPEVAPEAVDFPPEEVEEHDPFFGPPNPELTKAHEYLHGAVKSVGVTWEEFATWATVHHMDGVAVSDATIDQLRTLAEIVRTAIKFDKAATLSVDIKATYAEFGGAE